MSRNIAITSFVAFFSIIMTVMILNHTQNVDTREIAIIQLHHDDGASAYDVVFNVTLQRPIDRQAVTLMMQQEGVLTLPGANAIVSSRDIIIITLNGRTAVRYNLQQDGTYKSESGTILTIIYK